MNLQPILPETLVLVGIILALVADIANRPRIAWGTALITVLGALVVSLVDPSRATVDGMLTADGLAIAVRWLVLPATVILLLTGCGGAGSQDRRFVIPVLGVTLGALVSAAAIHIVPLFLGLELMSLAGYCLAAWSGTRRSAEAGMKYVLFGGVASAVSLFGLSHVYGLTGHLDLAGLAAAPASPALTVALALAGVSLLAKLAVVPLHLYAPDVYQGAPPLAVTVFGSLPKIAVIAVFARLMDLGLIDGRPVLTVLGLITVLWAALAALSARDAQRILAFSALVHAASALVVVSLGASAAALWYLAAYLPSAIGAFAALGLLSAATGLVDLRGVGRRRPLVAGVLGLCVVSLIGVPPLSGFFAKWQALGALFAASGTLPAVAAAALLLATATTAWAYLRILRVVILEAPSENPAPLPVVPRSAVIGLTLCVLATLFLGLWLDGPAALGLR